MNKAIVIGASAGIGRAIARELACCGYSVGVTARRTDRLDQLRDAQPGISCVRHMDVTDFSDARQVLSEMIKEMGGLDLIVINAGVDCYNPDLSLERLRWAIDTNVTGFASLADAAYDHFANNGGGHLCGMSSFAALRGNALFPTYSATKAFVSNYMEGLLLRARANNLAIRVTDIRPGFVDTQMTEGQPGMFWLATPEKVAAEICRAIRRGKRIAYVPRRWELLARLIHPMPFRLLTLLTRDSATFDWQPHSSRKT